jgi:hypothetical protein
MTAADSKDWLLAVSGSATLLSVAISSWLALRQYRFKLREEERLSVSARTERDIKLVKAFSELMDIAHGRSGHVLSEKTVEFLLAHNFVPDGEMSDPSAIARRLQNASVFALPVGLASQDAAIAALATLGKRHDVLRDLARQGLERLKIVRPDVVARYLDTSDPQAHLRV